MAPVDHIPPMVGRRLPRRARAVATTILAVVAGLTPSAARAQYQSQTLMLSAGQTAPRGSLTDSLGRGVHFMVGSGYHFGERFAVRVEGTYHRFERKLAGPPSNNQMVHIGAAGEISPFGMTGPYFVGGYGFLQTLKSDTVRASPWRNTSDLGGGLRLALPRVTLFGEYRSYRVLRGERVMLAPWSIGVRL